MNFKFLLIFLVILLFIIFLIQNTELVTVSFISFDATLPRSILLFITLILGVFIGLLLPMGFRKNKKLKAEEKQTKNI